MYLEKTLLYEVLKDVISKKKLRQKYSLSFFATTLLIALTTESSLAFSINPVPFLTVGATEEWDLDESYNLANPQRRGTTTLSPTRVRQLTRGGSSGFLSTLRRSFPGWTFSGASRDLSGSFEIKKYNAIGTPTEVGAKFLLDYIPGAGDPTAQGNILHWIQRVVNNHPVANNKHGDHADVIDIRPGQINPYYDTFYGLRKRFGPRTFYDFSNRPSDETLFYDLSARPDPGQNHNWLAELYLVEEIAPRQVRIYNGIQWGWQNRVESVPEPLTMLGAAAALGYGVILKRKSSKKTVP